jgi:hypothetical protein
MTHTWVSLLALPVAVIGAMKTYLIVESGSSCGTLTHGGNIETACILVALSGIAASFMLLVALLVAAQFPGLQVGILLVEALVLIVAIGLVAADSATSIFVVTGCSDPIKPHAEIHHVGAIYAVWGVPSALFLLRAVGAWTAPGPEPQPAS